MNNYEFRRLSNGEYECLIDGVAIGKASSPQEAVKKLSVFQMIEERESMIDAEGRCDERTICR